MEGLGNDAWTAARSCLEAISRAEDEWTQRSLWRAALKYYGRAKLDAAADPGVGEADRRFAGLERLGSFETRDWIEA